MEMRFKNNGSFDWWFNEGCICFPFFLLGRYLVEIGSINSMCELLISDQTDARVLEIVMDGLDKILKVGKMFASGHDGINPFAMRVEVCIFLFLDVAIIVFYYMPSCYLLVQYSHLL